MRRIPMLPLLALLSLCGCCGNCEWKEFSPTEGKCKVLLPVQPAAETQQTTYGKLNLYSCEVGRSGYAVGFIDLTGLATLASEQTLLDCGRDEVAGSVRGKVISESKLTLEEKYPGRDFVIETTDYKVRFLRTRIYLVGARLYQVYAGGQDRGWVESPHARKFLDSFALIK